MSCPRLTELPAPPADKTGWPWTEETPPLPDTMPDGRAWPRISVVTVSFNQGQYIEETIRSILLQGYPNLEYIIIDGGSTDRSIEIIRKYEPWLAHWVSEPDRGQVDAINKGLARSTGDIFNFINSDDYLTPGALARIGASFGDADAVAGVVVNFDETGHEEPLVSGELSAEKFAAGNFSTVYHQPGLWLRRDKVVACGGLDESLHYSFDWDLTIRYLGFYPRLNYVPDVLVRFRLHPQSKTCTAWEEFERERYDVLGKLSRLPKLPGSLRAVCDLQVRRLDWWRLVTELSQTNVHSRLGRALRLAGASCLDPKVRMTRFTLGTIRRVLSPNGVCEPTTDLAAKA